MCGRYAAAKDPDALVEEFEIDESLVEEALAPDYNVAPTKSVYAVMAPRLKDSPDGSEPHRRLTVARWGLVPSWAKDPSIGNRMINARVETAAEKPSYRRAFAARRCLLPADGFYEWYTPEGEHSPKGKSGRPLKQPFFIHRVDGRSLAMAGLYEWWRDKSKEQGNPDAWLLTATVLTTSSTDTVGRIHDRMPVVVEQRDWQAWLDPALADAEAVQQLLVPAVSTDLAAHPVSTRVNSVRNNGPELIEPLAVADD